MAWYQQRDKSEPQVIEALEACGFTVKKISARNFGDLVAANAIRTIVVECKTGKSKLRPGQQAWHDTWPGEKHVFRTADDVFAWHKRRF